MIKWPDNLIDDLVHGRCVLFLGSGISSNSTNKDGLRPPTWHQLLSKAKKKVSKRSTKVAIQNCLDRYDYLMACELIKNAMGFERFTDFLTEEFQTPSFNPAEVHKHIFNLDAPVVITPNFDQIYDTYVTREANSTIPILEYDSDHIISRIRSGKPIVLKIHGSIKEPGKLIFSKKDYAKARNEYASFYKLLESLILTKTFLFLGAGLNDPDIQLLLENYCFQYNNSRKHFFVIRDKLYPKEELAVYEDTLNLSFLKYKWDDKAKSHQDFLDSIADLVIQVDEVRSKLKLS